MRSEAWAWVGWRAACSRSGAHLAARLPPGGTPHRHSASLAREAWCLQALDWPQLRRPCTAQRLLPLLPLWPPPAIARPGPVEPVGGGAMHASYLHACNPSKCEEQGVGAAAGPLYGCCCCCAPSSRAHARQPAMPYLASPTARLVVPEGRGRGSGNGCILCLPRYLTPSPFTCVVCHAYFLHSSPS